MNRNILSQRRCWGMILLVLVACVPVAAQYTDGLGGNWNNPTSATITNIIMDRYAQRRLEKNLAAKRAGTSSTARASSNSAAPAARLNEAALHFRSTGTQLKTREIANLIDAKNPQVFTILTTILQEFDKEAQKINKPNDLALALSFFFAVNANVYHDAGVPPDAQVLELRDTIASILVEGNALNGVGDRQKQEMYEALVIYTGLALATYQEGKSGNAESLKSSQQLAGLNLLAVTGIAPDKISFSEQGLSVEREPAAAIATATQPPAEPTGPQNALAATVNAGKLVIDFEGNELRALQIYGGKRVRVNGTVNSIDVLKDGRITLTFHSPAAGYAHTRCFFNKSQSSRLAEIVSGQEAIVEGTVRGFGDDLKRYVELENCIVP
jgi:tRNA_anti-like